MDSSMNPFSSDQWMQQQYPNIPMARSVGEPTTMPVYQDSNQGNSGQSGPKPVRRRSRASRRTPTTVLNASPTDFRALVQRFTGCDSTNETGSGSGSVSVRKSPKGPVNIDFSRNDQSYTFYDNNQVMRSSSLQGEQMQSVSGLSEFQAGYGMNNNNNNASVVYESIDESPVMARRIDGGSHGYN